MCGIAGLWRIEPISTPEATPSAPLQTPDERVDAMIDAVGHRGPDARRVHRFDGGAFGHARLAIVAVGNGAQPYTSERGTSAVAANGEIYNYLALRQRLADAGHDFATDADTEVALHLFDDAIDQAIDAGDREPDAAARAAARDLDGMFAFAHARYGAGDDGLGADGGAAGRPETTGRAADRSLHLVRDPLGIKPLYVTRDDARVHFASEMKALPGSEPIETVAPGSVWTPAQGSVPYWSLPDPDPDLTDPDAAARAVRSTLTDAVEKRLMSDVPLGAFLSGGLDSSILVALAAQRVDELHTFAVGVEGSPDLAAARRVAEHVGTVHHEHILRRDEIEEHFERIVWALESFDRDLVRSVVPTYFTARLARERVKVVLTGEGADELFAGYTYYRDYRDPQALHRELRRSIGAMHDVNLQRVDRLTMTHGLEARVPFLDTDLLELSQRIPAELKLRRDGGGRPVEKWVLRAAFADLLPEEIVWRDKAQFDEGSGAVDLLPTLIPEGVADAPASVAPQDREEAWYYEVFASVFDDPARMLPHVGRWNSDARVAPA